MEYGIDPTEINWIERRVSDTILYNDEKVFVLDYENASGEYEQMYIDGNKWYFKDEHIDTFFMYYDFDNTTSYHVYHWDQITETIDTAIVTIDSIRMTTAGMDEISTQYLTVDLSTIYDFEADRNFKIYRNIGNSQHSPKMLFFPDLVVDVPPFFDILDLRCFTDTDHHYNFLDIPCDTSFVLTDIEDPIFDRVKVSPNPTHNHIFVEGIDGEIKYRLYSIGGRLVDAGLSIDHKIELKEVGVQFLYLYIDDRWIIKRIVKL